MALMAELINGADLHDFIGVESIATLSADNERVEFGIRASWRAFASQRLRREPSECSEHYGVTRTKRAASYKNQS